MKLKRLTLLAGAVTLGVAVSSCAAPLTDDGAIGGGDSLKPVVAVTTSILGDVVQNLLGEEAEVLVLMPAGSDPHNYQLSTKEIAKMMKADLLIENGLGLESGITASLKAARAEGLEIVTVGDSVDPVAANEPWHSDGDGESAHDEEEHDHGQFDPHFWHDASRMELAVESLEPHLKNLEGVDPLVIGQQVATYKEQLRALDEELSELYAAIPYEQRLLVTAHHVFGYLAERYELQMVGSILPSSNSMAETSAADIAKIAKRISELGVAAIFTDVAQSQKVAETVAAESGSAVMVVALYSESLTPQGGQADTYVELMRANARLIIAALKTA